MGGDEGTWESAFNDESAGAEEPASDSDQWEPAFSDETAGTEATEQEPPADPGVDRPVDAPVAAPVAAAHAPTQPIAPIAQTPTPPVPTPQPAAAAAPPAQPQAPVDKPKRNIPWNRLGKIAAGLLPLIIAGYVILSSGGSASEALCAAGEQGADQIDTNETVRDGVGGLIADRCADDTTANTAPVPTSLPTTVLPTTTPPLTTDSPGNSVVAASTIPATNPTVPAQSIAFAYPDRLNATGEDGAAGSGCSPGTGQIPDGVWFGFITAATTASIDVDLVCLWSGSAAQQQAQSRGETVSRAFFVTNDNAALRTAALAPDAVGYALDANYIPATPTAAVDFLADIDLPYQAWMYVNNGVITELVPQPATSFTVAGDAQGAPQQSASVIGTTCTASEEPQGAVLEVTGIAANDPDGGLNIRDQAGIGFPIIMTAKNGTQFQALGGCAVVDGGAVWWQITDQNITGWANANYLTEPSI